MKKEKGIPYGTKAQGIIKKPAKKKAKCNYDEFVEKAKDSIHQWARAAHETTKLLCEQKKLLEKKKGQSEDRWADNYVPTWKQHCEEILIPKFFEKSVNEWISLMQEWEMEQKK